MAYGQYVKHRDRNVSGGDGKKGGIGHHDVEDGENRSLSYAQTPAPSTINWKNLMASSARTKRRLGRANTNLVPQRFGKFEIEEDSSTETTSAEGQSYTASPPLQPRRSSNPSGRTLTSHRQPLSPIRTKNSSIDDILAKYAPDRKTAEIREAKPPHRPHRVSAVSPVRMNGSLVPRRRMLGNPDHISDLKPHRYSAERSSSLRPSRLMGSSNSTSSLRSVSETRSGLLTAKESGLEPGPELEPEPEPVPEPEEKSPVTTQSVSPPFARKNISNATQNLMSPLVETESDKLNTSFVEDTPTPAVLGNQVTEIHKTAETARSENSKSAFEEPPQTPNIPGANRISIGGKSYSVMGTIGSGGSAKVYRALDDSNTLVAIKRVDVTEASPVEAQSFRNEINLLQKLKGNPRIVTLYDSEERVEDDGRSKILYMVMEHGEKDLSRLLKELIASRLGSGRDIRSALTDAKIKFYWEEMLEAVQVIHREGIVHSDLKPANFLIAGGFLKLIDFGIASAVADDKTHITKDNLIGTFNFMSPEAIQDQNTDDDDDSSGPRIKISYKSDVWSLGCILYNLIYGKMPFGEIRNPLKKFQAILDPNHKIKFAPVVGNHDPLVVDVLKRCLVRDPSDRASIEELLSHPYLKAKEGVTPTGRKQSKNLEEVMSMLSSLTPNTRSSVVKNLTGGQP